jgi:galactose mutarotase-like enzyme
VAEVVRLRTDTGTVTIDPEAGGRIASIVVDGLELLVTAADRPMDWGCYVMAPFAGRLRNGSFRFNGVEHQLPRNAEPHAIHGTVFERPWKVEDIGPDRALLSCDLGPDWPFPGRVAHQLSLYEGGLDLRIEVAADEEPFPASTGWHPWWRRRLARGTALALDVDAESMWQRGPDGIPTGELVSPPPPGPWDDCLTALREPPVLRWDGALELTVESSCDDLVVFDLPSHAVCVEPQTGPPDALRLTPVLVEPGWPLVAETTFTWRSLA